MLNLKETYSILIATIVIGVALSFFKSIETFLYTLLAIFCVIIVNILAKKIASFYLDSEIEMKLWKIERYGFRPSQYFKKAVPAGIILPIIVSLVSFGYVSWLASLIFDVKPKIYRTAKRHGLYSYSEMTESHIGLIAVAGVVANLIFAVIGYLLGYMEFSRLNIYFAFFNMLPLSDLDGNKIFFGNLILWSFLAALVLIGLFYAFFLV
ncbi:MAG: hypothetical protein ABIH65_02255 [Nanoarchaeota archaeon]